VGVESLTFAPVEVIFADRAVTAESTHAVSSVRWDTGWLARAAVLSLAGVTWAVGFDLWHATANGIINIATNREP
jgi:hypothetical protein